MELRVSFLIIMLSMILTANGQQSKLPLLQAQMLEQTQPDALVHAFLQGNHARIGEFVRNNGGTAKGQFKDYTSASLPVSAFELIESQDFITAVHFELGEGTPLLSSSLTTTGVSSVHDGLEGLPAGYSGEGVIIGVIDAGIELLHPDFQHSDGSTRIIELWDQTMAFDSNRTPSYGYGQIWDSADINDSLCPHQDQGIYYGHGTNTTGIAASNGNSHEDFKGIAPETDLIIVSSDFSAIGWTSTIADAVDYIFERAEELGKPCVINASLGTYIGTHDGTDLPAQFIDSKITETPGRIMVCAAGNAGDEDPFHLGYTAQGDTHFTWLTLPENAPAGYSFGFELFGDSNDFERVQFSIGADQTSGYFQNRGKTMFDSVLNRMYFVYTDSLISYSGNFLAEVKTYAYIVNDVYRLQILLDNIDSVDFNYRLTIAGHGRFDTWAAEWLGYGDMVSQDLPSVTQFADMANYKLPDLNQSIVSSWACSDKVITVGNAINRNQYTDVDESTVILSGQVPGSIALTSSRGPTRTGMLKPETVAPGDNTLTAGAYFQLNALLANPSTRARVALGGLHHRAGGTSSASPVIAGIGALYLEKCPMGTWADFKDALNETSYGDQFTGSVPNVKWGNGKVDALELMKYTTPRPNVESISTDFCAGDSLLINLSSSYPDILWSTGDSTVSILAQSSGLYSALVVNEQGCEGFSDTMSIFERPIPSKPSIIQSGESPACTNEIIVLSLNNEYGAYEWSGGGFSDELMVDSSGNYYCVVMNAFGCKNISDTASIEFYAESPAPGIHLQADGQLKAILDSSLTSAYIWLLDGDVIGQSEDPYWVAQDEGVYRVQYNDSNGCTMSSKELLVYALGIQASEKADVQIWPNPLSDKLHLVAEREFNSWRLINSLGQVVLSRSKKSKSERIDVSDLPAGTYMMEVDLGDLQVKKKLVKW